MSRNRCKIKSKFNRGLDRCFVNFKIFPPSQFYQHLTLQISRSGRLINCRHYIAQNERLNWQLISFCFRRRQICKIKCKRSISPRKIASHPMRGEAAKSSQSLVRLPELIRQIYGFIMNISIVIMIERISKARSLP